MRRSPRLLLVLAGWMIGASGQFAELGAAPPAPIETRPTDRFGDLLPNGAVARLGTLRYRPACSDSSLAEDTSLDRKLIATGEQGMVRFWERASGKEIGAVAIGGQSTFSVRFSPDRKHLIALVDCQGMVSRTFGEQHGFFLIDVERQRVISEGNKEWHAFGSHPVFAPSGQRFLLREQGTLYVCDTATAKPIYSTPDVSVFQHSPDGKALAVAIVKNRNGPADAQDASNGEQSGKQSSIQVLDFASGRALQSWTTEAATRLLEYSADGRRLFTASADRIDCVVNDQLQPECKGTKRSWSVWDAVTRKEIYRHSDGDGGVDDYSLSPDGHIVQSPAAQGFRYWDVDAGQEVGWKADPGADQLRTATLADGTRLLAKLQGPRIVRLRAARNGTDLWNWVPNEPVASHSAWHFTVIDERTGIDLADLDSHRRPIKFLQFSPDGQFALTVDDMNSLRVWQASTGKPLPIPKMNVKPIRCTFLAGGKQVAAVGLDALVRVWTTADGKLVRSYPIGGPAIAPAWQEIDRRGQSDREIHCLFTPDGDRLIVSTEKRVETWNVADGKQVYCRDEAVDRIDGVNIDNEGRCILTRNTDGECRLETAEGRLLWHWQQKRCSFSVSGNGKRLAYPCDGGAQLVNLEARKETRKLEAARGLLSGDGELFAAETADKSIRVWDVDTGREVRTIHPPAEPFGCFGIIELLTAPDGRLIAYVTLDGKHTRFALLEVAANRELCKGSARDCYEFSPDGRVLATGGSQLTLREVATGKEIGKLPAGAHRGPMTKLAFTSNSWRIASAGSEGSIVLWDWPGALDLRPKRLPDQRRLSDDWAALANSSPTAAYPAILGFVAVPRDAVLFLRERLKPAAPDDTRRIRGWIQQLDDDRYVVRERAGKSLLQHGADALPALQAAATRPASAEAQRRIVKLLDAPELTNPAGERLRELRAIQALEWMDLPESRELLQLLASGEPTALRTREAAASLRRLKR
jgi:WD40 repeat protein